MELRVLAARPPHRGNRPVVAAAAAALLLIPEHVFLACNDAAGLTWRCADRYLSINTPRDGASHASWKEGCLHRSFVTRQPCSKQQPAAMIDGDLLTKMRRSSKEHMMLRAPEQKTSRQPRPLARCCVKSSPCARRETLPAWVPVRDGAVIACARESCHIPMYEMCRGACCHTSHRLMACRQSSEPNSNQPHVASHRQLRLFEGAHGLEHCPRGDLAAARALLEGVHCLSQSLICGQRRDGMRRPVTVSGRRPESAGRAGTKLYR